jgi:hypothetical protein
MAVAVNVEESSARAQGLKVTVVKEILKRIRAV